VGLEKLLPDKNHKWEIQTTGTGAFIINFSSTDLLETVVNWGPMDAEAVKGKIRFEKGTDNEVYKRKIDKVWVQFRGLPREFKEFPVIWASWNYPGCTSGRGHCLYKENWQGKVESSRLDPKLIPDFVDVVIGDYVYELQFGGGS
jgi:hypothetical protein